MGRKKGGKKSHKKEGKRKYTVSEKVKAHHRNRSEAAHSKRLSGYYRTARGEIGKPGQIVRMQNKLKWCKKYATELENTLKH